MDRDALDEEIARLQKWLKAHDPTTDEYKSVVLRLLELVKLDMELQKAHDDRIDTHDNLEFKYDELKEKERVEEAKRRAERRQIWWDIIKIGFNVLGSAVLMVFCGVIEQNVILGQHKWALVQRMLKF